jgi:hypothetical protein
MLMALWWPSGRLLLVILVTSLVPYTLTWSVAGGGEWRFTQHVYPMYLVCAFMAIAILGRLASTILRGGIGAAAISRRHALQAAAVVALVAIGWMAYGLAPVLIARETLAAEGETTIMAGDRDDWFFTGKWSEPIYDDSNVTVRVALSELTGIRLPLEKRDYTMTLRVDPPLTADPARQPRLTVFLNRTPVAEIGMTRDPTRMGTYRIHVPGDRVSRWNRIDLLASHTVRADEAGAPFESLPPDRRVAFRFWYVRVVAE